jgi:menaquinone-specific isochorismate synthase
MDERNTIADDWLKEWLVCGTLISSWDGRLLLGWGRRSWHHFPSPDSSQPSFYFPDFFLQNRTPWFTQEHTKQMDKESLLAKLSHASQRMPEYKGWRNYDRQIFDQAFAALQPQFASKEIDKAVPFVFEKASFSMTCSQLSSSLASALEYALKNPAYIYGFWDEQEGILGVTPEVLFNFNNPSRLETMACAGTKSDEEDGGMLLNDPKELHEHRLVVRGIKDALAPFGEVEVGSLRLLKLSRLKHLVTPIVLLMKEQPLFEDLVHALHPTPAVGAFPKKSGMQWLAEYQKKINRGRFGAPVGYRLTEANQSTCYVAIRNVQWSSDEMRIGAGCGLVAQSHKGREWDEINLKLRAIKEMLAL